MLSFLGPFQACLDGSVLTGFESNKARALLAYLAVESGKFQARETLTGLLWPEHPQDRADANLRTTLSKLRKLLGDQSARIPFLLVTRETVAFNPDSDFDLDVLIFEKQVAKVYQTNPSLEFLTSSLSSPASPLNCLTVAIDLLRGPFLDGFSLPDCPTFEGWALLKREQIQRQALQALSKIVATLTALGKYDLALSYAWRQIALEPWLEEAHQLVMRLLALSGQRSAALAQYETCCRVLQEELGVEPGETTLWLFEQIRKGEFDAYQRLPGFLEPGSTPLVHQSPFVARQTELDRLERALDQAMSGRGQVRFVTGSPGTGKTALVEEFIRRACLSHKDLVAARGNCLPYFGEREPYIPFREVLEMFTGEVEDQWRAGALTREQAQRLWLLVPDSAKALVMKGPELLNVFLPGDRLLERAMQTTLGKPVWISRLNEIHNTCQQTPLTLAAQQSFLFHQYKSVLQDLACQVPLLIFLDDLQWADPGSLGLLFSMGRSLTGFRILVVCAFRAEETLTDGNTGRHFLAGLVNEFKLLFNDLVIDLDSLEERKLVEAYLDLEPNRLDQTFRDALFEHTRGHPLFTIELLRRFQEEGQLYKNHFGEWLALPAVSWEDLPPRVEAVIAERINRLPEELRSLLQTASVEGETFMIEVLAQVQGGDKDQVTHDLCEVLDRQHQLVWGGNLVRLDGRRLSRYRFRHILFQRYLYQSLDPLRRALLHEQVGSVLENLYGGQVDEIALQLARHFELAGDVSRAVDYLYKAGLRASLVSANDEAFHDFEHALALLPAVALEKRFLLILGREQVYHRTAQRQAQEKDICALEVLAHSLGPVQKAQAALRRAHFADMTWNAEALRQASQLAITLGQENGLEEVEVDGLLCLSMSYQSSDLRKATDLAEQALALARQRRLKILEADILRELAICYQSLDSERVLLYAQEALSFYQARGDRYGEGRTSNILGSYLLSKQDYAGALHHFETTRQLCQETGNLQDEMYALASIVPLNEYLGRPEVVIPDLQAALKTVCCLGIPHLVAFVKFHLGRVYDLHGDYCQALVFAEEALVYAQGNKMLPKSGFGELWIGLCYCLRGSIRADLGQSEGAYSDFRASLRFIQQAEDAWCLKIPWVETAALALALGDKAQALACVEKYLPLLESQKVFFFDPTYFRNYLTAYQVLRVNQDSRAINVLVETYRRLQGQADCIHDENLRRSFLEAYPWNREIMALGQDLQAVT